MLLESLNCCSLSRFFLQVMITKQAITSPRYTILSWHTRGKDLSCPCHSTREPWTCLMCVVLLNDSLGLRARRKRTYFGTWEVWTRMKDILVMHKSLEHILYSWKKVEVKTLDWSCIESIGSCSIEIISGRIKILLKRYLGQSHFPFFLLYHYITPTCPSQSWWKSYNDLSRFSHGSYGQSSVLWIYIINANNGSCSVRVV